MQFWAVCIICLYVGIELFNWVTGLHWLADFSLPLSVVSGLSLAIASNSPTAANKAPLETTQSSSDLTGLSTEISDVEPSLAQSPPAQSPPPQKPPLNATEPSISFTIHKNVRP